MSNEFSDWFNGKSFSTDWTSRYFHLWAGLLAHRRDEPLDVLEIGSWEGRSAIFFLQYLKECHITCIDTFSGSPEHSLRDKWSTELPYVENRFDSNVIEFGSRIEKIKENSFRALAQLIIAERHFDLVFIDGSHHSSDVQSDAVLSWPMIRDRGIIIFDDYNWNFDLDEIAKPKLGVDTFLLTHKGKYVELHREYQLIIEKIT